MTTEIYVLLFLLGAALGSFIGLVASRYDPEKWIFSPKVIGGRSICTGCRKHLRWYELIPLVSYAVQWGKCRNCHMKLSPGYWMVELAAGFICVAVPYFLISNKLMLASGLEGWRFTVYVFCWTLAFLALLIISLIDARLKIIPDEMNVLLFALGLVVSVLICRQFVEMAVSFVGPYALLFGFQGSIVWNRLVGLGFAVLFFGSFVVMTKGRGMGMGDLKLMAALAFLFGWPDLLIVTMLGFILGSLAAVFMLLRGRKKMKGFMPLGPFLALACFVVFFFGEKILAGYFSLFRG